MELIGSDVAASPHPGGHGAGMAVRTWELAQGSTRNIPCCQNIQFYLNTKLFAKLSLFPKFQFDKWEKICDAAETRHLGNETLAKLMLWHLASYQSKSEHKNREYFH